MESNTAVTEEAEKPSKILELENVSKSFGGVQALSGANLEVRENEVMGLVGDNGAGKSTLVKSLVGIHGIDSGQIYIDEKPIIINNPQDARNLGIDIVYQDLALVDELSVAANTFLGRPITTHLGGIISFIRWQKMRDEADNLLKNNLGIDIDVETNVEYLSGGERQAVAINRALVTEPRLIIMDEPTSALSTEAAGRVIELINKVKNQGLAVLIISHNMNEIFSITDRVTVLTNGKTIGTFSTDETNENQISQMMISGEIPSSLAEEKQ